MEIDLYPFDVAVRSACVGAGGYLTGTYIGNPRFTAMVFAVSNVVIETINWLASVANYRFRDHTDIKQKSELINTRRLGAQIVAVCLTGIVMAKYNPVPLFGEHKIMQFTCGIGQFFGTRFFSLLILNTVTSTIIKIANCL